MLKNKPAHVFFYLPNIVGYIRIVFLILGLCISTYRPLWAAICFTISALLDMMDGFLARLLNQSSHFGAILDYAFDRAALACYLFLLAYLYPSFWLVCALLLSLDIMSHLFHLQSSQLQNKGGHKNLEESAPHLLRFYYKNRFALAVTCAMHDFFLCMLFLYHFYPSQALFLVLLILFPGFLLKTTIHIVKIVRASMILSQN